MTKINPYYIVKQAKSTEIFSENSGYDDVKGNPIYWTKARDTYTTKELPFFNKNIVKLPSGYNIHLSEFSLPLLGGLLGAYSGKGTFNKIKNGLLGALVGTGVHNIGVFSGLRDRFFNTVTDSDKPFATVGQREVSVKRDPTSEEEDAYKAQSKGEPNFILRRND